MNDYDYIVASFFYRYLAVLNQIRISKTNNRVGYYM